MPKPALITAVEKVFLLSSSHSSICTPLLLLEGTAAIAALKPGTMGLFYGCVLQHMEQNSELLQDEARRTEGKASSLVVLKSSTVEPHTLTCSQEEDLVAAVGRRHLVDGDGGELVVHVGPDHQGALVDGVDRVVHGGVVTHEVDDLVGVILGGLHVGGEGSSRTLRKDGVINTQP